MTTDPLRSHPSRTLLDTDHLEFSGGPHTNRPSPPKENVPLRNPQGRLGILIKTPLNPRSFPSISGLFLPPLLYAKLQSRLSVNTVEADDRLCPVASTSRIEWLLTLPTVHPDA